MPRLVKGCGWLLAIGIGLSVVIAIVGGGNRSGSSSSATPTAAPAASIPPTAIPVSTASAPTATPTRAEQLAALQAIVAENWDKNWDRVVASLKELDALDHEGPWLGKLYEAYSSWGAALVAQQNWEKAQAVLAEAIALDPERPEAQGVIASIPPPTPTPAPTEPPKPTPSGALTIAELPAYLETKLPKEARGTVFVLDDTPACLFTIADGFAVSTAAKTAARDFIFAAYATGLPIRAAQITIMQPNGALGLSVVLGGNVARRAPTSTWTNRSIGPTVFIEQMKQWAVVGSAFQGADRAAVSGPYAN